MTFLFTDVEGSTRRWEADAEGMRVALAAHDEVLRKAIYEDGKVDKDEVEFLISLRNEARAVCPAGCHAGLGQTEEYPPPVAPFPPYSWQSVRVLASQLFQTD